MEVTLFSYVSENIVETKKKILQYCIVTSGILFWKDFEKHFSPFLLSFFAWRPFYYHENL